MLDISRFNPSQLDAVREVGNIGTGNAATALSSLLNLKINMSVPEAELVSIYELTEHYDRHNDPFQIGGAAFVRSTGKFQCSLIFLQPEEDARKMTELLIKNQFGSAIPYDELPPEMADSAFGEVGNIVLSSFLNAINMLIGTQHQISVPGTAHDMLSAVLDVVASIYGQLGETALLINTELSVEGLSSGGNLSGHIIMLPDPESLELLLTKLKVV